MGGEERGKGKGIVSRGGQGQASKGKRGCAKKTLSVRGAGGR